MTNVAWRLVILFALFSGSFVICQVGSAVADVQKFMSYQSNSLDFSRAGALGECRSRANIIAGNLRTTDGWQLGEVRPTGTGLRIWDVSNGSFTANVFFLCIEKHDVVVIMSEGNNSEFMFKVLGRAQYYWEQFEAIKAWAKAVR